ncbi:tetratricopeptide repeat protein, partial [candidate division KSB1 bacterium]|nr:tetratricopeptide repeat protein [candidate division KSB1 bacterium]NIR70320.1 tetratricopeptide repeat protein [candidate division KSB1 bacterium]NIS27624.1 tetratricopeptide repeat protein [candidate division KSB1 bacterium]NIT74464.1 tetratricopeptide repeat protein [candidate division KSB1 bacterium]NIU28989.1 tetratricopeptide repeat protein [candidate division KSB1 bacterium]
MENDRTIISFGGCSKENAKSPINLDCLGSFPKKQLSSKGQLFVMATGMNGHPESTSASKMAVNLINEVYYSDPSEDVVTSLRHAFEDANALLHELFNHNGQRRKLGISCTGLVIAADRVYIAQIGGNHAFRITRSRMQELVETKLRRHGVLSKRSRFKREFTRTDDALGINPQIRFDIKSDIPVKSGDCFLLCTDGLVNVDSTQIREVVLSKSPQQACKSLIRLANQVGCDENINVQAIRISSASGGPTAERWKAGNQIANVIRWVSAAFLVAILGTVLFYVFPDEQPKLQTPAKPQTTEAKEAHLLSQGNTFYQAGELDIALRQFQAILQANPLHFGAMNGLTQIARAYEDSADFYYRQNIYDKAVAFYQKAVQLEPDNMALKEKISETESKLKEAEVVDKPTPVKRRRPVTMKPPVASQSKLPDEPAFNESKPKAEALQDEWLFPHLTARDFELDEDRIIFLESANRKKALLKDEFVDVSFRVQAKVGGASSKGRFGLIIGYRTMAESPYEFFYLFSVSKQQEFLLQKYSNFKKEAIVKLPVLTETINEFGVIRLQVTCRDNGIALYANRIPLHEFEAPESIHGAVG